MSIRLSKNVQPSPSNSLTLPSSPRRLCSSPFPSTPPTQTPLAPLDLSLCLPGLISLSPSQHGQGTAIQDRGWCRLETPWALGSLHLATPWVPASLHLGTPWHHLSLLNPNQGTSANPNPPFLPSLLQSLYRLLLHSNRAMGSELFQIVHQAVTLLLLSQSQPPRKMTDLAHSLTHLMMHLVRGVILGVPHHSEVASKITNRMRSPATMPLEHFLIQMLRMMPLEVMHLGKTTKALLPKEMHLILILSPRPTLIRMMPLESMHLEI
mmetsp:Transcript_22539/g.29498  ORF Transcript_22539/g.29498 Transcript_22539/m.29498 type:complete len:266 (+) Transcript_22539:1846-2643(+)